MTEQPSDDVVRVHDFDTDGPIEIDVATGAGQVDIRLSESASGDMSPVHVELRHDPSSGSPWTQGMAGMLNWVSDQFGDQLGAELRGSPADAVADCTVDMAGNRLVVRSPRQLPLRHQPLAVSVVAPAGSSLKLKTGSASVTVTGQADRADVATSSGDIALGPARGSVTVRSGSGGITLGPVPGSLQLRTSGGEVRVQAVGGSATLATGTGNLWVGAADGDLLVRTGSGDVTVADAGSGSMELMTGSGEVRIGVREGIWAEVDVSSGSGSASSELAVSETPPSDGVVALRLRARTGSGRVVVGSAQ